MSLPRDALSFENLPLLEAFEQQYLQAPTSLDSSWKSLFEGPVTALIVTNEEELFRRYGHFEAKVYPQGIKEPALCKLLPAGNERLRKIYCGSISYEFAPFCDPALQDYIIGAIEPLVGNFHFSKDDKLHILHLLNLAESFETFLHTRYVGQKRFSLEGAETLIPMLAALLDKDLTDVIIGMPHRGRLNVLVNILKKSYSEVFSEFEDVSQDTFESSGDVKYHKGYSSKIKEMNVVLAANPSHLESVDAVVEGIARAKQSAHNSKLVLPVLIHGDAAVSGQGIVYETLQLSRLEGYKTHGTIHIVINNHIGFTTLPEDGRSTEYCTDIAKAFNCPIIHVNAEDPEACLFAMNLAFQIRTRFATDIFIDLNCWRKYGHNESDEPAFTQPLTYQTIRKKPSIRTQYHDRLVKEEVPVSQLDEEFKRELHETQIAVKAHAETVKKDLPARTIKSHKALFTHTDTHVDKTRLQEVIAKLTHIPEGFTLHPRIKSLVEARAKDTMCDWSFAESLALGTLLQEGVPIRFAGQDSRRGTFSQRHGMWVDQVTGKCYFPLASINSNFELIDSLLSEYAALGFEYGYSLARPQALVLWEAQFGDFANGAQIVIDQYIASGEQKWGAEVSLVLLLPHGYEGQGPEHSSARIERFLTLAAEDNMIITNPTTPAQYFHLLRRQKMMKKPLIVFTPKGLLRLPECQSSLEALTQGQFEEVLDDTKPPTNVKRLIFCQGRIYYDLVGRTGTETAIIRIEQLYPLHREKIEKIVSKYSQAKQFLWVQEEPYNMGAWFRLWEPLQQLLPRNSQLEYRGRAASSSPACGSHLVHEQELELIMTSLFQGSKS